MKIRISNEQVLKTRPMRLKLFNVVIIILIHIKIDDLVKIIIQLVDVVIVLSIVKSLGVKNIDRVKVII